MNDEYRAQLSALRCSAVQLLAAYRNLIHNGFIFVFVGLVVFNFWNATAFGRVMLGVGVFALSVVYDVVNELLIKWLGNTPALALSSYTPVVMPEDWQPQEARIYCASCVSTIDTDKAMWIRGEGLICADCEIKLLQLK